MNTKHYDTSCTVLSICENKWKDLLKDLQQVLHPDVRLYLGLKSVQIFHIFHPVWNLVDSGCSKVNEFE